MKPMPRWPEKAAPEEIKTRMRAYAELGDALEIGRAIKETRRCVAHMVPYARDLAHSGATRRPAPPGFQPLLQDPHQGLNVVLDVIHASRVQCRALVAARADLLTNDRQYPVPQHPERV